MDRYGIIWVIGLLALSSGIYLTLGVGPSLIVFGIVTMTAGFVAARGKAE